MSLPCYVCGFNIPEEQVQLVGRCNKTQETCICKKCHNHARVHLSPQLDFSEPGPKFTDEYEQFFKDLAEKHLVGYYGCDRNEDGSYTWYAPGGQTYTAMIPNP